MRLNDPQQVFRQYGPFEIVRDRDIDLFDRARLLLGRKLDFVCASEPSLWVLDKSNHHGHAPHNGLKECSAYGATRCARKCMSDDAEALLLETGSGRMRAQNAGDYLNDQIGECPSHPAMIAGSEKSHEPA
jgi:hypothetical protein